MRIMGTIIPTVERGNLAGFLISLARCTEREACGVQACLRPLSNDCMDEENVFVKKKKRSFLSFHSGGGTEDQFYIKSKFFFHLSCPISDHGDYAFPVALRRLQRAAYRMADGNGSGL